MSAPFSKFEQGSGSLQAHRSARALAQSVHKIIASSLVVRQRASLVAGDFARR